MTEEVQKHIFEKFYQGDNSRKAEGNVSLLGFNSVVMPQGYIAGGGTQSMDILRDIPIVIHGRIFFLPSKGHLCGVAEKQIADEETVQQLIKALEQESIKYETFFKLIIATGMRRGECCGLKWSDFDFPNRKIHIQRNVVKITGEEIIVKETKTASGDRYVYFSSEMESLLLEYRKTCQWETEAYDGRKLTEDDYVFRRHGLELPMTPTTFTWRFKKILKAHGLPGNLNVHSLRHTNASLLIAGGTDVTTVASLLGHAQPSTTLDIYSHAFDKNKKEASQTLHTGLGI